MSLFDDASLVLTPNGYKASKLYSIKPTSGAGDMVVSRGTTATRVDSAGLIESVAINVPRLDYTGGGCPSILVESARINRVLRSEEFDNVYWGKVAGGVASAPVVTANVETAPDGTTTADRVVFNLNGGTLSTAISQLESAIFTSISITRTQSVYIKTTDGTTKVFTFVSPTGSVTTITVTSVYQRFTLTSTGINTASIRLRLRGSASGEGTATSATIAIWGAQYEDGSTATSYIPTVASQLQRNADVISKTGVSNLIGQTNGTIFVEANLRVNADERRLLTISNGTELQRIIFWTLGTTLYISFNGVGVSSGNFPIGTAKIAVGYTIGASSTTYSIKVNNNTLITGTAAAAPNPLSAINLGSNSTSGLQLNDRIESATLFTTRLIDQQLATLTAI